jgi:hypothetical protein
MSREENAGKNESTNFYNSSSERVEKLKNLGITQHFSGDEIEKNETGGTCSTYDGEEWHIQGLVGKT